MKIAIIGTKGIPARYGGFETFAFQLAKHLSLAGHDITVVNEKGNEVEKFEFPVTVIHAAFEKSKNPLQFYRQSLRLVAKTHELVLVCGVGGSVFYPLNKGNAIIVTNVDGLEHLRGKYSFFKKLFVFILQRLATHFSDYLVADSNAVKNYWLIRFANTHNKLSSISYGADAPISFDDSILNRIGVEPNDYYLVVARLVPENNIRRIVSAFEYYRGNRRLVIVGNTKDNVYSRDVSICEDGRVQFIGTIYNKEQLDSLRKNCFAYIHGHSVGGTNPSLLEAMICRCACICDDNVFNREVTADKQLYFKTKADLFLRILELENNEKTRNKLSISAYERVDSEYSWPVIVKKYEKIFGNLLLMRSK